MQNRKSSRDVREVVGNEIWIHSYICWVSSQLSFSAHFASSLTPHRLLITFYGEKFMAWEFASRSKIKLKIILSFLSLSRVCMFSLYIFICAQKFHFSGRKTSAKIAMRFSTWCCCCRSRGERESRFDGKMLWRGKSFKFIFFYLNRRYIKI